MLARFLAGFLLAVAVPAAGLPDFYHRVSRVTWVVKDASATAKAWEKLGLTDVRDDGPVTLRRLYRGRAGAIRARYVSGRLGGLSVDFLEPLRGNDVLADFLSRHGGGIFSIVYAVGSEMEVAREAARIEGLGVRVLERIGWGAGNSKMSFVYFDTEPQGKYVLGLVYQPGPPAASAEKKISHIGLVAKNLPAVSDYWKKLGFPGFPIEHAAPRPDGRYRERPLLLAFEVGFQKFAQFPLEWISAPAAPRNVYSDFLRFHGEGVEHLGMPVEDLQKAVAEYKALGYAEWQAGAWGDVGKPNSGRYVYMDTDRIGGVSVELIHAYGVQ